MRIMVQRRRGRVARLALLAVLCFPTAASAFTFSFGDVDPGDVITALSFNTSSTLKLSYDGTSALTMQGYLTQIDFANKGPIGGTSLPGGVVQFSSTMMLLPLPPNWVGESATNNPIEAAASFMNGVLLDLSIFDTACVGSPVDCTLLEADWVGALLISFQEAGAVTNAEPDRKPRRSRRQHRLRERVRAARGDRFEPIESSIRQCGGRWEPVQRGKGQRYGLREPHCPATHLWPRLRAR